MKTDQFVKWCERIFKVCVIAFIFMQLAINRTQIKINTEQIKNNALQQQHLQGISTGLSNTYQQQVKDWGENDRRLNRLEAVPPPRFRDVVRP